MIAASWRFISGRYGAGIAGLAAAHTVLVGSVAWYVVDAVWGSVPTSASLTPVPRAAFTITWVAGTIFLLVAAPILGAAAVRVWVGPDPTAALPTGLAARAGAAWLRAVVAAALVALGPLPVYVVLHALGSFTAQVVGWSAAVHAAVVAVAPVPGIVVALAARRGARR